MNLKNFFQVVGNGFQYLVAFTQIEDVFRIVGIILSAVVSVLIIADKIVSWFKKAKADGKITSDELKEGIEILKDGTEEVKDHIDKLK